MGLTLLALGLVLIVEGLVFALAPCRLEDLIRALATLSPDARRALGLAAIGVGAVFVWGGRALGVF